MENQTVLWEENYQLTRKCIALCILTAVACFIGAVLAEFVFNPSSEASLSDIIARNYSLIGMITCAALTLACCAAYLKEGERDLSTLSENEVRIHTASLRTVRGVIILFCMLFGVCNFLTPPTDIYEWVKGSFASSVLVAIGFGSLFLAILSQKMANTIKTKYLNH